MPLRSARILYRDRPAGTLIETPSGGSRFVYDPEQTESIACCLPASRHEHDWPVGLHPFFQHLTAEGWLRERQARTGRIDQEDDFGLLLRYGADCIGAVGVIPAEAAGSAEPARNEETIATRARRTISGVQRKLLVTRGQDRRFDPVGSDGPAPYIAKFNDPGEDTLVRNERLSLDYARKLLGDIEVTRFEIGEVSEVNETALVVERFDRTPDGRKLRMEDFAQILAKPRGRDYGGKYDAGYEEAASVITGHSARPRIDLDRFFRRIVVFALLGNCDAHLKNFSLLETAEGLRLSPLYDVLNTAVYSGFSTDLALTIGGRHIALDDVDRALLTDFGLSIGLRRPAVSTAFRELGTAFRKHRLLDAGDEATPGFRSRYTDIVRRAWVRILEAA